MLNVAYMEQCIGVLSCIGWPETAASEADQWVVQDLSDSSTGSPAVDA